MMDRSFLPVVRAVAVRDFANGASSLDQLEPGHEKGRAVLARPLVQNKTPAGLVQPRVPVLHIGCGVLISGSECPTSTLGPQVFSRLFGADPGTSVPTGLENCYFTAGLNVPVECNGTSSSCLPARAIDGPRNHP